MIHSGNDTRDVYHNTYHGIMFFRTDYPIHCILFLYERMMQVQKLYIPSLG